MRKARLGRPSRSPGSPYASDWWPREMDRLLLLLFHRALVPRIRSAGEVFKMRNKNNLMNLVLALGAVFVFSVALRAQTADQSGVATARSTTPTVDLSGVWEANMPGLKWA